MYPLSCNLSQNKIIIIWSSPPEILINILTLLPSESLSNTMTLINQSSLYIHYSIKTQKKLLSTILNIDKIQHHHSIHELHITNLSLLSSTYNTIPISTLDNNNRDKHHTSKNKPICLKTTISSKKYVIPN